MGFFSGLKKLAGKVMKGVKKAGGALGGLIPGFPMLGAAGGAALKILGGAVSKKGESMVQKSTAAAPRPALTVFRPGTLIVGALAIVAALFLVRGFKRKGYSRGW